MLIIGQRVGKIVLCTILKITDAFMDDITSLKWNPMTQEFSQPSLCISEKGMRRDWEVTREL